MRHFLGKIQRFESKRFEPESNNTKGKLCNFLHRQCNICRKKRTKSGGFLSNLGLGPFLQRRDETNRTCLTKCTKIVLYEKQSFKKSFENNSRRQPGATLSSPFACPQKVLRNHLQFTSKLQRWRHSIWKLFQKCLILILTVFLPNNLTLPNLLSFEKLVRLGWVR